MKRLILGIGLALILFSTQAVCDAAAKTIIIKGKETGKYKITVLDANPDRIRLQLKNLAPSNPGITLTLKTEVPKDWSYVLATQGSSSKLYPVSAKMVQYEAVPENGEIRLTKSPGPVISRCAPVFDSDQSGTASLANDHYYFTSWSGRVPGWIAYDLSRVPVEQRSRIIVVWYAEGARDYDHSRGGSEVYQNVGSYTIEGNKAAGGVREVPETGWDTLATVMDNKYHSRQHLLEFLGYNWLRMRVTAIDGMNWDKNVSINLDVHDRSGSVLDDWIFYGDSITAAGMDIHPHIVSGGTGTFAQMVNVANPSYFPVAECGGIGGLVSGDGVQYLENWLSIFPGTYVGLSYGTNDAWRSSNPDFYYENMKAMVEMVLAAGKIPVIPTIPWSSKQQSIQTTGAAMNQKIFDLYAEYPQIIHGPDLWNFFKTNPDLLSPDGVHPSDAGYVGMRREWVKAMIAAVYKAPVKQ
jgi:lysophospholipase L1-like esterase